MECEQGEAPSETMNENTETATTDMEEKDVSKPVTSTSPESNKENVNSEDTVEEENKPKYIKSIPELHKSKSSPFTNVNAKQKKALTPGSRGAMLLNLSRRVSVEPSEPVVTRESRVQAQHVSVSVSPMRPWVKYAPSPSHASPSAGILKRAADDLDSSNDGSPVCVKRIRLDVTGSNPRRVHFNDNPVSESVEIPRTPKQQYTRKKLQMSALAEADDKDEEMEGVTSLVMYPDLVDNTDNISSVLHNLATGQWARFLEQDLKKNDINTIGQLAGLDAKTVGQLRGVKPPKIQTVKQALAAYHNKVKKEENTFRRGTPVLEETSQEEEERIKAEFFSRPSPSPTDMTDVDAVQEDKEITAKESNTEGGPKLSKSDVVDNEAAEEAQPEKSTEDVQPEKPVEEIPSTDKVLVEESPDDDEKKIIDEEARTSVPDTETMNIEAEENIETKECIVNVTDVLSKKETSNVDEESAEVQPDKEDTHESNEMDTNEDVVDNPASANAAISDNDVESDKQINKNKETNH